MLADFTTTEYLLSNPRALRYETRVYQAQSTDSEYRLPAKAEPWTFVLPFSGMESDKHPWL